MRVRGFIRMRMGAITTLSLVLPLSGCARPIVEQHDAERHGLEFEQYEIVTASTANQTVLTGFFLGGPVADLAVVDIDENDGRRLRIYALGDGEWAPKIDATLRPDVLFVDVANIGGCDRLITYEHGCLNWFDPDAATERPLVEVATSYNATPTGLRYAGAEPLGPCHAAEIPHVDITPDVNRDGRDDLVVPDLDGFWVSVQSIDGTFTDPVKLGPPEPFLDAVAMDDHRTYRQVGISALTIPWYLSRVHVMDYNHDGRSDLVFWNNDHFDVHYQDERGLFAPPAETFVSDVPFDSDGSYSLMFGFKGEVTLSLLSGFRKKTKQTVLHSFRDMNGDGVADLVTRSMEGRSILKQRSLYKVHFGTPAPGGTSFAPDVGMAVHPRGRAGGFQHSGYASQWFQDFDGDGQVDIMFRDVAVGFVGMTSALVGKSVGVDLEFYRGERGTLPDKPTTTRKIRRFAPFEEPGKVFFPAVLMGDANGDGRSDLLVGQGPGELHVFLGVSGPDLLARKPRKLAVTVPYDERNTWLADLNKDGKQDVLIHHAPTEPHRLTMLIAR